jgi:phosphoglycerate kinase
MTADRGPALSMDDADVAGKRVLVRVDFNVPLDAGRITDDTRIRATLPTVRSLRDRGARLVLVSHLGRPKGKPKDELRLRPVADRLAELIGHPVRALPSVVGDDVEVAVAGMQPGDVVLLENVRFEPGEEQNSPELAQKLARLADLFVNDAFGAAHRAHASTVGVTAHLPAYAGLLMQRELAALNRLVHDPARPFVAILGGAKVSDKLGVIEGLLDRVDTLLVGGGMANTFLLAQGHEIGGSLVERDLVDRARQLIGAASERGVTLALPTDAVVAANLESAPNRVSVDAIPADGAIYDIGPTTRQSFAALIAPASTLFWNGPMGVFEQSAFATGTEAVARAVAETDAYTVVGGGDSIAAITQLGVADRISHVSTGGGASLEFVEGRTLPGVAALLHAEGETV